MHIHETKLVTKEEESLKATECDSCHTVYEYDHEIGSYKPEVEFAVVDASWGYNSADHKDSWLDGTKHVAFICSRCFIPTMERAGIKLYTTNWMGRYVPVDDQQCEPEVRGEDSPQGC